MAKAHYKHGTGAHTHGTVTNVVTQLHHCVTAVVAASFAESFLWYADYEYFNSVGTRPVLLAIFASCVGAARKRLRERSC